MRIVSTLSTMEFQQGVLWVWLYIGPDLILPLTSALAAIAGVLLMFWHKVVGLVSAAWRFVFKKSGPPRG